jgi:4-amino-4-deoxy-L-arabinose transferase-like glycosyltransferase
MLRPAHLLRIERLTGLIHTQPAPFACLLCAIFILAGLVGHQPWKPDEAYIFGVVYQMLQSGDWVVPRLAGEAFLSHPPLFYLVAGGIGSAFAPPLELHDSVRLASGLFMAGTLILVGLATRELLGPNRGWVAALMVLGTTGLLVRSHQLIPDLAYLLGYATSLYAIALYPRKARLGGVLLGTGIGLAFMSQGLFEALVIVLAAGVCLLPLGGIRPRASAVAAGVAGVAALPWLVIWPALLYQRSPDLFAHWLWMDSIHRITEIFHLTADERPFFFLRALPWFGWPALPLAAWALWASRRSIVANRALLVPLIFFVVELLSLMADAGGRDVQGLPLLLPLAILATFSVASLPRGAANAWFWFSIALFSFFLLVIWFYFGAIEFAFPTRLAQHMHEMQPGYAADTPMLVMALAGALTVAWFFLLFNVRRSPERPIIVWTAGVTIVWSTLILLMVGYADTGKSYRWMVTSMHSALPSGYRCVGSENLGEAQRAMLHYYAGIVTRRKENPDAIHNCDLLLVQDTWKGPVDVQEGWQLIWQGARPGDNVERYRLFRKLSSP